MTKKNNGKTLKVENVFNRLSKNKRGISAVISSVIMVAAVIAVGLSVVAWTTGTFARQQSDTAQFFSDRSQAIRENFVIEDVWFNSTGAYITVRNVGDIGMNVTAIYFNGGNPVWESSGQTGVLVKGQAKTFFIGGSWTDAYYYVTVSSARGQQVREYYGTSG